MSDNNNSELVANRVSELAKSRKSDACNDANGITECSALVLVGYDDGFVGVENTLTGNPVETLPEVLDKIAQSGLIYWHNLSFVTEAFMRNEVKASELDTYKQGDLEKEYKENPATDIIEGILVHTITWQGETNTRFTPYTYNDHGRPVFAEPYDAKANTISELASRMGGRGIAVLRSFSEYCHTELDNDKGREYIEALSELIEEKGLVDAVAHLDKVRNENNGDPEQN